MGIMICSLLRVLQDLYHQPYSSSAGGNVPVTGLILLPLRPKLESQKPPKVYDNQES